MGCFLSTRIKPHSIWRPIALSSLIQSWMKTVKIYERVKVDLGQEVEEINVVGEVQMSNKGGTTVKRGNSSVNRWWLEPKIWSESSHSFA
jgi:hypothetical protein